MSDQNLPNNSSQPANPISPREQQITLQLKEIETVRSQLETLRQDLVNKLSQVSSMTTQEAHEELLKQVEKDLADEIAKRIKQAEEEVKLTADAKIQTILMDTMVHGATDYLAEYTVSSVKLASDEIKGRIIGREGKNIRTFEQATGVEIDMDETNTLRLSSFDPVRREIARRALLQLIKDARIQPDRIEEVVAKIKQDIDKLILEAGEELCHTCKIYNLPLDLVKILGRYKFRFSYGQSMINHTIEETKIGVSIAGEIGADVQSVRLAC